MSDVHTAEQRRRNMAAIRGTDTRPELIVRRLTHRLGFRHVLGGRGLPGRPDLVFPGRRKAIQVHGCFWHCHACRQGRVTPRTNAVFWADKRRANVERDQRTEAALRAAGWDLLIVWECETRDLETLRPRLAAFLTRHAVGLTQVRS